MKYSTLKLLIHFLILMLLTGFLKPGYTCSSKENIHLSPVSLLKFLLYQHNPADLRDKATLTQKLNFLCNLKYASTEKEKNDQIQKLIYLVLDDFYWNRILALHHLQEICSQNNINDLSPYIQQTSLEGTAKKEILMWMELLSSDRKDKEGILEASYRIHRQEKQQVLSRLNALLYDDIDTIPREFLAFIVEESIQKHILERENYIGGIQKSGTFFRSLSQWISFKLNQFGLFKSEYAGETEQRALLAWQTMLDVVKIKELLVKKHKYLSTDLFLYFLSDSSIATLMAPDYEKRIQIRMKELGIQTIDPHSSDPSQQSLRKMLIQMAIQVSVNEHNNSEKGRTGALMVDAHGKILGISFNGPPIPDREHMGTEWAFDSIIPKTQKTNPKDMNENFSDIRERMDFKRSPCAEKKSIFQAMLKDRTSNEPAFLFVSRAPCYQCASVLKQENITAIVPEGLVENFTSQFYDMIGFKPIEIPMSKYEMLTPELPPMPSEFNIRELIRILNNEQNSSQDSFQLHKIMNSLYEARLMLRKNSPALFSRDPALHLVERSC